MRSKILVTSAAVGLVLAGVLAAQPLRWKLDLRPSFGARNPAGRLELQPPKGPEQVYWYVVYEVTNVHPEPVTLNLVFRAQTDASDQVFVEGYYPRAMERLRSRFGDDVQDVVQLTGRELAPGGKVRGAAVFQFYKPGTREFDERGDRITVRVDGYADPVKREGLEFTTEDLELWMHFERRGDEFDPRRESVRYVGQEERVVTDGS